MNFNNEFKELIEKYKNEIPNINDIDKIISKLFKSNDLKEREQVWNEIIGKIANPYFAGFGNPDSEILIIGKELGFDINNVYQFMNESINNLIHWDLLINNQFIEIEHFNSPLLPYYGVKKNSKNTDNLQGGHTWQKYNILISKLVPNVEIGFEENKSSFLNHCFITEYNHRPSKYSTGKGNLVAEREEFLKNPFFKRFKYVINTARAYDERKTENIFNVKHIENGEFGNSGKKQTYLFYKSEKQTLIFTNQLSGSAAWSDSAIEELVNKLKN